MLCAFAALTALPAHSGGLLTNTNQNASFLRQMSQESIIDITGLYANPAGTAFLAPGFHLSLNVQNAKQSRDITTTFPLFAYNRNNPQPVHRFEGDALAPVIPSFHLSYNWEGNWSVNASFALVGGGGKCEFDQGLGTFEALYAGQIYSGLAAQFGTAMPQLFRGYSLNAYMKGRSYQFGFTVGTTYKILENLSAFLGTRLIYATNNYNGWVTDAKGYYLHPLTGEEQVVDLSANSLDLNADQVGFSATPIIGLDWLVNEKWNLAFKYEMPTRLSLENKTEANAYTAAAMQENPTLGQFADGKKVREDIPGILAAGAQYRPTDYLRFMAGWHYYFYKQAKKEGDKQKLIDKGTIEFNAGGECDLTQWLTFSASLQCTRYRVSDAFMNDLSFNVSSNAIGLGVRVNVSERCNIDLGYMHNFYHRRDVDTPTAAGMKSDHYYRRNRVLGIGANLKF